MVYRKNVLNGVINWMLCFIFVSLEYLLCYGGDVLLIRILVVMKKG